MADRKISDLTALTTPATGDLLPIVDVSEAAAADKNKSITVQELFKGVPDGTAAAPGLAFESDDGNGIYKPGTDQVAISTNGTGRLFIDSSGNVGIGVGSSLFGVLHVREGTDANVLFATEASEAAIQTFNNAGSAEAPLVFRSSVLKFKTSNTEQARIDSSGRLLVGTSSARSGWFNTTVDAALIQSETTDLNVFSGVQNSANAFGPWMLLGKSRGSSAGAVTVVQNNDQLGSISFQGADGTEMVESAKIQAFVDGTPGTNDMPGRLVFSTTADGASSPTERMRIDSSGRLLVGTGTSSGNWEFELKNSGETLALVGSTDAGGAVLVLDGDSNGDGLGSDYASVAHNTDGNLVLNNRKTASIIFQNTSSSTERMRIDSSGRVGIGTSSPGYKLDVQVPVENGTIAHFGSAYNPGRGATVGLTTNGAVNDAHLTFNNTLASYGGFKWQTNGTDRVLIDPSGRVGIGTTSPSYTLDVTGSINAYNGFLRIAGTLTPSGNDPHIYRPGTSEMGFWAGGSDRMRIDSSGRLLVGTTTARENFLNSTFSSQLQVEGTGHSNSAVSLVRNSNNTGSPYLKIGKSRGTSAVSNTVVQNGDGLGVISFQGADGSEMVEAAAIIANVDGTPGANDMPGRLVFSTTADGASSPTERMRITSNGTLRINSTVDNPGLGNNNHGFGYKPDSTLAYGGVLGLSHAAGSALSVNRNANGDIFDCRRSGTQVGSISVTTTSTSFNTSSDYRLKENVVDLEGAITRVKQLAPKRFNFIADETDTLVDGFLAHEAQIVVPEAVTGAHNEVQVWQVGEELPDGVSAGDNKLDENGNTIPKYQGIDQSKLVPLLTAALQEAIAKIETLEAKVATLEAN